MTPTLTENVAKTMLNASRRRFLQTTAAGVAGCLAAATVKPTQARATTASPVINVTHEWGTLKEVIIGRADNVVIPDRDQFSDEVLSVAPQETVQMIDQLAGKPWSEGDPETAARATEQQNALAKFLEDRGVIVHRPADFSAEQLQFNDEIGLVAQLFPRDPMVVVGNHVIETNPRISGRDRERFGYRDLLRDKRAQGGDFKWVSMPVAATRGWADSAGPDWNREACLAGGDTFILGDKVLIGWSGQDTTPFGIEWLSNYLSDFGYTVESMRINEDFLHLDDGLAILDEGLAIVCKDQFSKYGMPKLVEGWDLINVTAREAKDLLAGNGLILGPREIIIDSRLPHIGDQLDKRGVTVHMLDYDAVTTWAGGFRCSHHPLVREL